MLSLRGLQRSHAFPHCWFVCCSGPWCKDKVFYRWILAIKDSFFLFLIVWLLSLSHPLKKPVPIQFCIINFRPVHLKSRQTKSLHLLKRFIYWPFHHNCRKYRNVKVRQFCAPLSTPPPLTPLNKILIDPPPPPPPNTCYAGVVITMNKRWM